MSKHTKYSHIETESQPQPKIKYLITCITSKNTMILEAKIHLRYACSNLKEYKNMSFK